MKCLVDSLPAIFTSVTERGSLNALRSIRARELTWKAFDILNRFRCICYQEIVIVDVKCQTSHSLKNLSHRRSILSKSYLLFLNEVEKSTKFLILFKFHVFFGNISNGPNEPSRVFQGDVVGIINLAQVHLSILNRCT